MRIAVIILNWNTRVQLERWLPGIADSCKTVEGAEVIVADNGSTDGSVEFMRKQYPGIELICFNDNLGFTGGYNKAIEMTIKRNRYLEYVVLINSDIEVSDDWLSPLASHMDNHPECAACGPKLLALDRDGDNYVKSGRFEYAGAAGGYLDRFGYPFCRGRILKKTETDFGQYDGGTKDVLWVSGACMMVRVSAWGSGLDERFFAHMEEIDWCWRKQLEGYRITVVPQSRVWHLGGGTLAPDSPLKLKLNFRNNLLMLDNNLSGTTGRFSARCTIVFRMILDGGSALTYLLGGRKDYFKSVVSAHKEYRILRRKDSHIPLTGKIAGFCRISIILQSLIRKEGVFEYIRRYENCH